MMTVATARAVDIAAETQDDCGERRSRMNEIELRAALEEHHQAAFGWAMHCCERRRDDALDALQSAYVKALSGKAAFNGCSSFKTWLFAIIRNTAIDQRRSFWRRFWRGGDPPEQAAPERTVERLSEAERSRQIEHALAALSVRQREVLHLVFYQEMTVEQAAGVMDVSVGAARTHYDRGKANLRRLLGEAESVRS